METTAGHRKNKEGAGWGSLYAINPKTQKKDSMMSFFSGCKSTTIPETPQYPKLVI